MNSSLFAPLFIRTDASSKIGIGHLMRCLALAQAWKKRGGQAAFIGILPESLGQRLLKEGFSFHELPAACPDERDLQITLQILQKNRVSASAKPGWVVVDGYHLNADFQNGLRKTGFRVLLIDDYGHQPEYAADIILNQNPGAEKINYPNRDCRFLLGTKYALLRNEFLYEPLPTRVHQGPIKNILISMGGADPGNATLKILHGLAQSGLVDLEVRVLIGPVNVHKRSLDEFRSRTKLNFCLIDSVQDMRPLIQWADLAVSAAGSTCFEFAYLGVPMVLVVLAENQRQVAEALAEKNAAINLGWAKELSHPVLADTLSKMIENETLRADLVRYGRRLVDGKGRSRVVEQMIGEIP